MHSVATLAKVLDISPERLIKVADSQRSFYDNLLIYDSTKPHKKPRSVYCVTGALRKIQGRLLERIFAPRHKPSLYSHGGIKGRSIKSNALAHLNSVFSFSTDVKNFYPSISHQRVYGFFVKSAKCSPDVARILTKLCTHNGHLALGLLTSPIIADAMMKGVDRRISAMCAKNGLIYTRFVDDITITGGFPIDSGGFIEIVTKILGS